MGVGVGIFGALASSMAEAGITNEYAQKALLANIKKESNFVSQTEDVGKYSKTSNERIRKIFTTRVEKYSDELANVIPKFWLPKWGNVKEPSARVLSVYKTD